jgi:hypothetical protein
MLPVPYEAVPSAVITLFPAFLQVLKAAGECLFRYACELHRRSHLNSLDSHVAVLLAMSYWKHHDSSSAMILSTNVASFCASCNKSAQIEARCSNRTSILQTAKIATGKGHGDFRRVLPPSGGRAT